MPRIAIATAVTMLLALPLQAEETAATRLQAGLEELGARLALTSGQEERVRSIVAGHVEAQKATLEKYGVNGRGGDDSVDLQRIRALREELRANGATLESRLSGVLSGAQMETFRRIRAEREAKLRDRILSGRLDEIGAQLELTPEQADRVRPVLREHFEAQMAVLDRHGVAPGNRDGGKRPGLLALRRLRKELDDSNARTAKRLSAILSGTQLAAYEALQAEQRRKLRALFR